MTVAAGNTVVCVEQGVKMRSLPFFVIFRNVGFFARIKKTFFCLETVFIPVYSKTNDFLSQRKNRKTCGFVVPRALLHISYTASALAWPDRPTNCQGAECSACCHRFWVWRRTDTKLWRGMEFKISNIYYFYPVILSKTALLINIRWTSVAGSQTRPGRWFVEPFNSFLSLGRFAIELCVGG